ncbi:TIGR03915 family putative DNA repair protein [Christensenella sp. NSJ-35]|uniref:TIGR03915 family putative DNA repair protein n=2 Tax=Christensenella tenuis TaxID=2763033 RepID=A0ABR7EIN1_9FIRM|nr:TIGR03915 family putative DNA repair protein [Christensenella tenuis]MBC5649033.1 TIGR03915 family putative DNA repair protein [Christensenella tenuis]
MKRIGRVRSSMIYQYDGSFDGLLCCVFESVARKEVPEGVYGPGHFQMSMFETRTIETDPIHARRVLASIPKKMGREALDFVRKAFLTCLPEKERHIVLFLRMGYEYGSKVMRMLADDVVNTLFKAVKHLEGEAHLLTGFIRFSIHDKALVAQITPKNYVLPILAPHFRGRYPDENFLIYDKTHGDVLVYEHKKTQVFSVERFALPDPDEEERRFRALWRMFYETIAVPGRENPRCRMAQMPKRYWENMTEFAVEKDVLVRQAAPPANASSAGKRGLPKGSVF